MLYAQKESIQENKMHQILWDFEIQTDHLISDRRPFIETVQKIKKRSCRIVDFAVPMNHKTKIKESEKRNKYLDLAKEPRNTER